MWLGNFIGYHSQDAPGDGFIAVGVGISVWRRQMCCLVLLYCFPCASIMWL